jgi:hypothetical protein
MLLIGLLLVILRFNRWVEVSHDRGLRIMNHEILLLSLIYRSIYHNFAACDRVRCERSYRIAAIAVNILLILLLISCKTHSVIVRVSLVIIWRNALHALFIWPLLTLFFSPMLPPLYLTVVLECWQSLLLILIWIDYRLLLLLLWLLDVGVKPLGVKFVGSLIEPLVISDCRGVIART